MTGSDPFDVGSPENPQGPPLASKHPQEEDHFSAPPLPLELPIDIERHDINISNVWARVTSMISGRRERR